MAIASPKFFRVVAVAGLLGAAASVLSSRAVGQGLGPDPYQPYNAAYESYVYPTYPTGAGVYPNQGMVTGGYGLTGSNQFNDFLNDLDGPGFGDRGDRGPRRGGPGVPYYAAYRDYDRDFQRQRSSRPNNDADSAYFERQRARTDLYMDWLKEKNPQKKAKLYREWQLATRKASRDLADPRAMFRRNRASEPAATGAGSGAARATDRPGSILNRSEAGSALSNPRRPGRTPGIRAGGRSPSQTLRESEKMDGVNRGTRSPQRPSSYLDRSNP